MRVNDDRTWLGEGAAKQYICTVCKKTAVDSSLKPGNPRRKPQKTKKVARPKPPPCPNCGKQLLSGGKLKWYCNPARVNKQGIAGCGRSFYRKDVGEVVDKTI
jgi:DNA-directed RNA polymerase subunit RPC12/RpoP